MFRISNFLSVLQYSVEVLKVKHIIICGHYGCGGIAAAIQPKDLGLIDNWLRNIRDVYRIHDDELSSIEGHEERLKRLVEVNVMEQCHNVFKTGVVQASRSKSGFPRIHGMVYDLSTGRLKKLHICLQHFRRKYAHIYKIAEHQDLPPPSTDS